jgi:hypothetical protein
MRKQKLYKLQIFVKKKTFRESRIFPHESFFLNWRIKNKWQEWEEVNFFFKSWSVNLRDYLKGYNILQSYTLADIFCECRKNVFRF